LRDPQVLADGVVTVLLTFTVGDLLLQACSAAPSSLAASNVMLIYMPTPCWFACSPCAMSCCLCCRPPALRTTGVDREPGRECQRSVVSTSNRHARRLSRHVSKRVVVCVRWVLPTQRRVANASVQLLVGQHTDVVCA